MPPGVPLTLLSSAAKKLIMTDQLGLHAGGWATAWCVPMERMDELVEHWPVLRGERDLIETKHSASRLAFTWC
jgi:hypothetical protein